jgi:hypothetical protein
MERPHPLKVRFFKERFAAGAPMRRGRGIPWNFDLVGGQKSKEGSETLTYWPMPDVFLSARIA